MRFGSSFPSHFWRTLEAVMTLKLCNGLRISFFYFVTAPRVIHFSIAIQMVTCDESAACGGFRLGARDDEPRRSRAPSVSSLSLYKQKIDALFDDTRSVASLPQYGPNMTVSELERRDSKVSRLETAEFRPITYYYRYMEACYWIVIFSPMLV